MPILKSTALSREALRRKRKHRSSMIPIGMPATLLKIPIAFFPKRTPLPWTGPASGWICRVSRLLPSLSRQNNINCTHGILAPWSFNAQAVLHLLQRDSLGLGIEEQHHEKLQRHHDRE